MRLSARKKRKLLGLAALIALAGLVVYLILFNCVFLARSVRVEGNQTIGDEEIMRAARLPLGEKLGAVDEELVRAALESGGRVELVRMEKRYPSEIVLTVRERSRDAVVAHAGVILVLERDGHVVEQLKELPDIEAVYVTGLNISAYSLGERVLAPAERLEAMRLALEAIYAHDALAYVSEINVSDANSIYLYSRTGMRVELGDDENMDNKILWMVGALSDLEARGELTGTLDVSSGSKADYSAG